MSPRDRAQDDIYVAMDEPYTGTYDPVVGQYIIEPEFEGLTCQQVIIRKARRNAISGDQAAINAWLDRVIGKPKQSVENLNVGVTLQEYLDQYADLQDEEPAIDVPAEPAEPNYLEELG